MPNHIFFSWQADTPNSSGRNFLRQVLEEVCEELSTDSEVDEAIRDLLVDSDTQGIAGQPPIAETILKKIDGSAVVVCDMTLTGKRLDGRPSPNPNVLIEYGWALKALGYNRVISVMNIAFGKPNADNLPFDLAHLRWPMQYELPPDTPAEAKATEKKKLRRALKAAIQASLATVPAPTVEAPPAFPEAAPQEGHARFRAPGESLGFDEDLLSGANREVFLASGPAMWLRIIPAENPGRRWKIDELREAGLQNSNLFPLLTRAGGYSYVRASDGFGIFPAQHDPAGQPERATRAIGFAFRTGEVWSIDTSLLSYNTDRLFYSDIETAFTDGAQKYRRFQLSLGIPGPFRWKAGLTGIKGRHLGYAARPGHVWIHDNGSPICVTDQIEVEGALGSEGSTLKALLPLFERLFEECGIDRPDYLLKE
jgi:hypothetical protein